MEKYKIDLAQRDGVTLHFSEKSVDEAKTIIRDIGIYLGSELSTIADNLIHGTIPNCWEMASFQASDVDSERLGSVTDNEPYLVVWGKEAVDSICSANFIQCFDYYWFESCDDIFVVSSHTGTVFFIRHDGAIFQYMQKEI